MATEPPRTDSLDTSKPWVTCRCPCGGEFTAGTGTSGQGFVVHTLPACEPYLRLDVTLFLADARKRGARPIAVDVQGGS